MCVIFEHIQTRETRTEYDRVSRYGRLPCAANRVLQVVALTVNGRCVLKFPSHAGRALADEESVLYPGSKSAGKPAHIATLELSPAYP
jgi:hypothetical protein